MAVDNAVENQKQDTRHEQPPEKPECPGDKLIVSTHGGDNQYQALSRLMERIGVGHTSGPVAELLVEYAKMKP